MAKDGTYKMKAKICVALPTSNNLHQQIIEGIVNFAKTQGMWQLFLVTEDDCVAGLKQARHWGADGVIALGDKEECTNEIISWNVPMVLFNCSCKRHPPRTVFLMRDQENVGKAAAEYFLERGYRSFAFIGTSKNEEWSFQRLNGYAKRLKRSKHDVIVYPQPSPMEVADFGLEVPRMRKFLQSLPTGTALFIAHDRRAQLALELCNEQGISVPERISVLGIEDYHLISEALTPSLSSISLDGVHSGWLASELLNELLDGKNVDPVLKLDFPTIITRQSTDATAIEDTVMARTLAKITANLSKPLRLNAIADELGYSVRTLEMKSRKVFGCTLKEKVKRIRLNEAVRLLSNTKLSVQEIAERCGFCGASHLGLNMREAFGYPPSVFRH